MHLFKKEITKTFINFFSPQKNNIFYINIITFIIYFSIYHKNKYIINIPKNIYYIIIKIDKANKFKKFIYNNKP